MPSCNFFYLMPSRIKDDIRTHVYLRSIYFILQTARYSGRRRRVKVSALPPLICFIFLRVEVVSACVIMHARSV